MFLLLSVHKWLCLLFKSKHSNPHEQELPKDFEIPLEDVYLYRRNAHSAESNYTR